MTSALQGPASWGRYVYRLWLLHAAGALSALSTSVSKSGQAYTEVIAVFGGLPCRPPEPEQARLSRSGAS